jgi:NADPH-dependent 2,4-dienoyl-CoA reductase/sulfur reductase-like enzyme
VLRSVAAQKRGRLAKQPAVIGGGLIGIEAVEVALAAGLRPRFFIRDDCFWPIALEPRESKWISDRMAEHGVHVHLDHEVEALEGDDDGNVIRVRTDRGSHDTDCVLVAIGVIPATQWLQESGIELDDRSGGIVVDQSLRTSVQDVYAAGDCAAVRWFEGSRRPEQLWYTARDQGRVAGRRMVGEQRTYQRGIWYNSAKLIDIEYTTVGLVNWNVKREKNWFFEETGKVRSTTRIVVQDDRVVGFNMLGRRWDHSVLIRWIEQRRSLDWVLGHLDAARFDTELVPPLRIPQGIEPGGPAPNPSISGTTEVPF